MDDASLDDFAGDDGGDGDGGGGGDDDPAPAVSTYDFSPDGATCASCDAEVVRRWRDEGELVCGDCKRWG